MTFKEADIRNRDAHTRYLELVRQDAQAILADSSALVEAPCPACGGKSAAEEFEKAGFRYVVCSACHSLYVSPRPRFEALAQLYGHSASTQFWVKEFFAPVAEARRTRIFRPRAEFVSDRFTQLSRGRVGDIGAGFGLFLEELRHLWPSAELAAIEPSAEMAERLRSKRISVVESMLEDVPDDAGGFDLLTAFELFEHLHTPTDFLQHAFRLLRPGGFLYLTTLNGQGFDIQIHWQHSKAVFPPHHLNFLNPGSLRVLLARLGFAEIEIDTPGRIDWDIVESALENDGLDPGRFFRTVAANASPEAKAALQAWLCEAGFSSHMRAVARRPSLVNE